MKRIAKIVERQNHVMAMLLINYINVYSIVCPIKEHDKTRVRSNKNACFRHMMM